MDSQLARKPAGLWHDRSLSSVARDESRMARDESRMARDESRMTGDYCRPEESIHRCVHTHSHLYSYIYSLVALLDNIQSTFSKYHYLNKAGPARPVSNTEYYYSRRS